MPLFVHTTTPLPSSFLIMVFSELSYHDPIRGADATRRDHRPPNPKPCGFISSRACAYSTCPVGLADGCSHPSSSNTHRTMRAETRGTVSFPCHGSLGYFLSLSLDGQRRTPRAPSDIQLRQARQAGGTIHLEITRRYCVNAAPASSGSFPPRGSCAMGSTGAWAI